MGEEREDGRSRRRERNRQAVVEAVLALMTEGVFDPSVELVAERSGLSARSIFRYFDHLDDLRQAVLRANRARVADLVGALEATGTLEERIRHFAAIRVRLCEEQQEVARLALSRELAVAVIADELGRYRALLVDRLRSVFAPELAALAPVEAEDALALAAVVVSFEGWDFQSRSLGRSRAQIQRSWIRALAALLAPGG